MTDEPTGRYVVKLDGKPLAAKTFHLYEDCGIIRAAMSPNEYPASIIEPSDEIMAVLELRLCQQCDTRSKLVAPEDVIAGVINIDGDSGGVVIAADIIAALNKHGYVIRQERKRVTPTE